MAMDGRYAENAGAIFGDAMDGRYAENAGAIFGDAMDGRYAGPLVLPAPAGTSHVHVGRKCRSNFRRCRAGRYAGPAGNFFAILRYFARRPRFRSAWGNLDLKSAARAAQPMEMET